jgi:hypothetical protein
MVHGLYDYLITISEIEMFLCLIVLIDIISIVTIIKASRNDKSVMIDDEEKKKLIRYNNKKCANDCAFFFALFSLGINVFRIKILNIAP